MAKFAFVLAPAILLSACATDPATQAEMEAAQAARDNKQVVTGSNIPRRESGAGTVGTLDPKKDPNAMQQVQDALKNSGR